ncbi:MAG: hypothetical protein PQJ59_12810 [Spirochaetales bacterium]|nr:hypothetical protein [Spirochaetales bacterium]
MKLKTIENYRTVRDADKIKEKKMKREIMTLEGQLLNAHNAYVESVGSGTADSKLFKAEKKAKENLEMKRAELSAFQEVMSNRPKQNPDLNKARHDLYLEANGILDSAEKRRAEIVKEMEKLKQSSLSLLAEYETIQREEINLVEFLGNEGMGPHNFKITREFYRRLPLPSMKDAEEYVRKNVTVE